MFWKKDKEKELEKKAEEIRKMKIKKAIEEVKPRIELVTHETKETGEFHTAEYYQFLKDIKKEPKTLYEKLCWKAERLLTVKPDKKARETMLKDIQTAYLNVTPEGVTSLTALTLLLGILITIASAIFLDKLFSFILFIFTITLSWYVYKYPSKQSRSIEIKMSSDLVLSILYMVVYMRTSPNLEGAIRFAADNLTGPLSWDLKKLIWDLEVGKYPSLEIALSTYLTKWRDKNEEFIEAMQMLKASTGEVEERRLSMMDEAVNIMLYGTRDKMRHYAQSLRTPIMLVYAMGVMLPVIGLVMFPIIAIFMSDIVRPAMIFIGYDILLPLFLLWYMSEVLKVRPATFSQPEINEVKGLPPMGKFKLGKKIYPIWPFAILSAIPFIILGAHGILTSGISDFGRQAAYSVLMILGLAVGIFVYSYLDSFQKMPVRKDIEKIEEEFGEALFQLGNQVASGRPIETALDYAIENMRTLKISDFFRELSINMKKLGITFYQALFDEDIGVVRKYPSRLIKSVFKVILESSKKSVKLAALTMLTISRYLRGIKMIKEEIHGMLSETLSSMKFLATFLLPIISGVTVTMAIVIIQILFSLSTQLSQMTSVEGVTGIGGIMLWGWSGGGEGPPISPAGFQIIVGLYMIETSILLAYFINRIEYGEDAVGLRAEIANILMFSTIVYLASWFITYKMFAPFVSNIIMPYG